MILETKIISDFEELQKKIPWIIEAYGMQKKALYEHIRLSKATLDRKLKSQTFTIREMYRIAEFYNALQDPDNR
ncbi:MAG: hypothetical protein Q8907_00065 [Bacteroidota bacterium]|nr:hypothetical protein [Bacteroidota bacterium]MDP4272656.1 hypothetical protein [Bacteroidota bacterium]